MKVILINIDGSMEEVDIEDINKLSTNNDIQILYQWNYNNSVIKCYGNYIQDNSIISNHKLPAGGMSDIIDGDSYTYDIYGNIYIVCFQNDKIVDYDISDYGNFHYIMNETYNVYDSDDISDEEVLEPQIIVDKTILHNTNKSNKTIDNISDELDIDDNVY